MSIIDYNKNNPHSQGNLFTQQRDYSTSAVQPGFNGRQTDPMMNLQANYGSHLVHTQNYIPSNHQPLYGYSPHISYSGTDQAPINPYTHVRGSPTPQPSKRFVTYYPYTRYYTDYEEQVVMVPVEKTRTKYAEKVI